MYRVSRSITDSLQLSLDSCMHVYPCIRISKIPNIPIIYTHTAPECTYTLFDSLSPPRSCLWVVNRHHRQSVMTCSGNLKWSYL